MKHTFAYNFFVAIAFTIIAHNAHAQYTESSVNVGNMGVMITNAGTIGNPNIRSVLVEPPSMEYPINSGVEHLFEAGLWIGALTNGQIAVSTASLDDASGYATGKAGFEFTPIAPNTEKSSLTSSDKFSTSAISHQDFTASFTDKYTIVPNTNQPIDQHITPLYADVKLQTHAWNYSFADFFVVLDYEITNNGTQPWDSVYLGIWSDLVVRNVQTFAGGTGSVFFAGGTSGYLDSLTTIYAYEVINNTPSLYSNTQSYGAIQFLGAEWRNNYMHPNNPNRPANFKVFPNYWIYNQQAPTNDLQRYARMRSASDFTSPLLNSPSNSVQLLSAGPFEQVAPGEKVKLSFAVVCAKQLPDNPQNSAYAKTKLKENLAWARRTYLGEDINENGSLDANEDLNNDNKLQRYILPEPPAVPKTKIVTETNKITVYWNNAAEQSIDPISKQKDFEGYRLYRSKVGDDLNLTNQANLIRQWDTPQNPAGYNNGLGEIKMNTPKIFDNDTTRYTYKYELTDVLNAWQYVLVLTSFDGGDVRLQLPSLESSFIQNSQRVYAGTPANTDFSQPVGVYPNPYRVSAAWDGSTSRNRKIMFYNLPARAEIRIYTVAGDVVANLYHDASAVYNGSTANWYNTYDASGSTNTMPEGEHAWDILSDSKQAITTGLYLFSVKDLVSNKVQTGKFAVIK
jgi:hypothetical protein